MKITIGIKALNEEKHIGQSLASAFDALRESGGEIILADSGSIDQTIEIARLVGAKMLSQRTEKESENELSFRIYQLANPESRSCGAGAQLAFQFAQGDYFYLLDGDMVLHPDFLSAGITYLEQNANVIAVGGRVIEANLAAEEFQIRSDMLNKDASRKPGVVDRLDCGGFYRSGPVRDAGYFADRNLHSFEEFELAARMQSRGWKFARIDNVAVHHYGHTASGYRLLWRRLRSGYAGGVGEVLRSSIGTPQMPIVLRRLAHIRYGAIVMFWWFLLIFGVQQKYFVATLILLVTPLIMLSFRRRSLALGLYSMTSWNVSALGLIAGFVRKRARPEGSIPCVDLSKKMTVADAAYV